MTNTNISSESLLQAQGSEQWVIFLTAGIGESREITLPKSVKRGQVFATQGEAIAAGRALCDLVGTSGFGVKKLRRHAAAQGV